MIKIISFLTLLLSILGYYFYKNNLIVLLLFLEVLVVTYVFSLLEVRDTILYTFNLSINFIVFGVIAATLGLSLLRFFFKRETKERISVRLL